MVAQQLQRDDVQQSLETIDSLGNPDRLGFFRNALVAVIAQNDGLRLACGDLGEGGLDLGVERVLGHDNDDGHVLVDESEGTVLELSSKDTLRVHVADFLDLESTLEAGGVSAKNVSKTVYGRDGRRLTGILYP